MAPKPKPPPKPDEVLAKLVALLTSHGASVAPATIAKALKVFEYDQGASSVTRPVRKQATRLVQAVGRIAHEVACAQTLASAFVPGSVLQELKGPQPGNTIDLAVGNALAKVHDNLTVLCTSAASLGACLEDWEAGQMAVALVHDLPLGAASVDDLLFRIKEEGLTWREVASLVLEHSPRAAFRFKKVARTDALRILGADLRMRQSRYLRKLKAPPAKSGSKKALPQHAKKHGT